jgi:hypothetical protein
MTNDPTKELALMEKRFDETIEMVEKLPWTIKKIQNFYCD